MMFDLFKIYEKLKLNPFQQFERNEHINDIINRQQVIEINDMSYLDTGMTDYVGTIGNPDAHIGSYKNNSICKILPNR